MTPEDMQNLLSEAVRHHSDLVEMSLEDFKGIVSKLDSVTKERDELAAREAMFRSHDCSNNDCAVLVADDTKGGYAYSKEADAFVDKYYALKAERDSLSSRLENNGKHIDQARRDLRQALDLLENGEDGYDALRTVTRRIYEAGKQLALATGMVVERQELKRPKLSGYEYLNQGESE